MHKKHGTKSSRQYQGLGSDKSRYVSPVVRVDPTDEVVRWEGVVHVRVHRVQVPAAVTVASPNRRLAASKLEPTVLFVISMVAAHTWKSI